LAKKKAAERIIEQLDASAEFDKPIVTSLEKAGTFWPAEAYHQKYTEKTGIGACHIDYAPA
jgi:peptide-methionine (S)-S-oxide reductase